MKLLYYADRISDNIRKREPEGYLICVNVPIARSGKQQYLQDEIGQDGDGMVSVERPEEEVFSPATIASFEGMPVTNDHPNAEEGVTVDNISYLQKGHCQNVHRGTGSETNMLIADLVITDPGTIQDVLDGKREISCGYNYELCEEDGKFVQRQIRGNHIAIVDRGRAGHRVCIKDSAPRAERSVSKMAKTNTKMGILAKMFGHWAKDAEPEEIAEAAEVIDEIASENPDAVKPETVDEVPEKLDTIVDLLQNLPGKKDEAEDDDEPAEEDVQKDDEPDKQDIIIDLLKQLVEKQAKDDEPEEADPLEKLEDDLDEIEARAEEAEDDDDEDEEVFSPDEDPSEPESHFVDPEEINEQDEDEVDPEDEGVQDCSPDKYARDAMRAAIKAVKPMIAKLPPAERRAASDAAVASLRKSFGMSARPTRNDYIRLNQRRRASDKAVQKKNSDAELAKRIMASRNANYKK